MSDNEIELFARWIQRHVALVNYIEIDPFQEPDALPKGVSFAAYRQRVHRQTLDGLYKFESAHLKPFTPERVLVVSGRHPDRHCSPETISLFHKLCFLEDKLFRYRSKVFQYSTLLVNSLIELLVTPALVPSTYLICVDTTKLFTDILSEPSKLAAIKSKYRFYYQQFRLQTGRSPSLSQQRQRIRLILSEVETAFLPDLGFFAPTPSQHLFERLIFLPSSCCYSKLNSLIQNFSITKPQDFIPRVIEISEILADQYHLQDANDLAGIATLLLRVVFDEVYDAVDNFRTDVSVIDILSTLRCLTVAEIEPPLEYCPPMSPADLPGEILRSDFEFGKAIECLEMAAFFTNPLDVLHQFHQALKAIEQAADAHLSSDVPRAVMLPFDVTFGLFLCCLLGAAMPDYVRIAEFAKAYAPRFLNPSFEFALAKVKAATAHLTRLCQEEFTRSESDDVRA
jgi:hypothetical protein